MWTITRLTARIIRTGRRAIIRAMRTGPDMRALTDHAGAKGTSPARRESTGPARVMRISPARRGSTGPARVMRTSPVGKSRKNWNEIELTIFYKALLSARFLL
jgi:hypothetical protein